MDYSDSENDSSKYFESVAPEEMLQPEKNPFFYYIIVTNSITFFVGVVGNVFAVTVMVGDRKGRNATNLFLVSLAVADLLLLLLCIPLETLQYFLVQWNQRGTVCAMTKFVEVLSATASVLNLCAVSLERFIVIVFPMRSRSLCTIRNCRKSILIVWIAAIILSLPSISLKSGYSVNYRNQTRNVTVTIFYCLEETPGAGLSLAIYKVIILFAAPGLLMIICYTYVIRELWKSTRNMSLLTNAKSMRNSTKLSTNVETASQCSAGSLERSTNEVGSCRSEKKTRVTLQQEERQQPNSANLLSVRQNAALAHVKRQNKGDDVKKARKQVIKMLILVILLFLICWGPKLILNLTMKLMSGLYFTPNLYFIKTTLNLVPFVHSCINPLIYSFMSKNFRRSMQRLLQRLCACFGCNCVKCSDQSSIPLRSTASARTRTLKGVESVNSSNYFHLSDAPNSRFTEVDCVSVM